jgi:hypothetical protein
MSRIVWFSTREEPIGTFSSHSGPTKYIEFCPSYQHGVLGIPARGKGGKLDARFIIAEAA